MITTLLWAGSPLTYLVIAGIVYRYQYIRTYKEWRRWQAEAPDQLVTLHHEYRISNARRHEVPYWEYMRCKSPSQVPGIAGLFWLPVGLYEAARKVLRPEIEMPDYGKIKGLETTDFVKHTDKALREWEDKAYDDE